MTGKMRLIFPAAEGDHTGPLISLSSSEGNEDLPENHFPFNAQLQPPLDHKTPAQILHESFHSKREESKCSPYILQEVERGSRISIFGALLHAGLGQLPKGA